MSFPSDLPTQETSRLCQTIVHKDTPWKGKYLSLVLQSSERSREDKAIVISLKFGSIFFSYFVQSLQSKAFV